MRQAIDFHTVLPIHRQIHDRLENWARYVRSGHARLSMQPMWRFYVPDEHWEGAPPSIPVDSLDGSKLEKAVWKLPEKNRDAVRWCYVYTKIAPWNAARHLGVSQSEVLNLIENGRTMLKNSLTAPTGR